MVDLEPAAVLLGDALAGGETQTHAALVRLGGEARREDAFPVVLMDACAGVTDPDDQVIAFHPRLDHDPMLVV